MTLMLGIDTATTGCSVALMDGATCLAENQSRMPRGQSEALAPMIEDVMKSAGISFDRPRRHCRDAWPWCIHGTKDRSRSGPGNGVIDCKAMYRHHNV